MICITGASGFIASNLIEFLNTHGFNKLILIDYFDKNKNSNIEGLHYSKKIDLNKQKDFNLNTLGRIDTLIHLGAITDTQCKDINLIHNNNFLFSKKCFEYCSIKKIKFIYASSASVYGKNKNFIENPKYEAPINLYAYSKKLFDDFVREKTFDFKKNYFPIYGLRFFNVYGLNEFHKKKNVKSGLHFLQAGNSR